MKRKEGLARCAYTGKVDYRYMITLVAFVAPAASEYFIIVQLLVV